LTAERIGSGIREASTSAADGSSRAPRHGLQTERMDNWDGPDPPDWQLYAVGRLGPGEGPVTGESYVVYVRPCWQCGAPIGELCRPLPTARRFRGAHAARYANLTSYDMERNREAIGRPCTRCAADPSAMCRTVPVDGSLPRKLRQTVHAVRESCTVC
jgi:hypothetical protein